MNVRSKYDVDEPERNDSPAEHVRGMCGIPYEMFAGPARVDVSKVKAPKFFQRIFETLGWKTNKGEPES